MEAQNSECLSYNYLGVEHRDIVERVNKLKKFMNSIEFRLLDNVTKSLIKEQFKAMNRYVDCIESRAIFLNLFFSIKRD